MLRLVCLSLLIACGCGGGGPAPSTTNTAATVPSGTAHDDTRAANARAERERHDALAAQHRVAELEQQNALAAACAEPPPWNKHARCAPSCYPTEPADARADHELAGAMEIQHVVCRRGGDVPYAVIDELGGASLRVQRVRGRLPRAHRKGWQADVAAWFRDAQPAALPRTDVVLVKGRWRTRAHPLSKEKLSCVTVSHYARGLRGTLDACGAVAKSGVTCEAEGSPAARAINVVHYRLAEARRLEAAHELDACREAALEAVAVARGLPRWRQYKKLNVDEWNDRLVYRTRFDGVIDEDALFAAVATYGSDAEAVYVACGGAAGAATKVDQEQSFHTCW